MKSKTFKTSEKPNVFSQDTYNTRAKCQSDIFILDCSMAKENKVNVMTSLFETQFWAFVIVVHENKGHFWNHDTKLDKIGML